MQWLNEPSDWKLENTAIKVTSDPDTDFWRKTHYGFIRDTGHFYYQSVTGNFTAEVKVIGKYKDLYDQAGLMLRVDESNWLKCGIELVDNIQQLSVVVTRDYSDWSILPMADNLGAIWLKITRQDEAIEIYYSLDSQQYNLLRMTYLSLVETVDVGIMCASPKGEGFTATFEKLKIQSF